jgi:hypothetical protein
VLPLRVCSSTAKLRRADSTSSIWREAAAHHGTGRRSFRFAAASVTWWSRLAGGHYGVSVGLFGAHHMQKDCTVLLLAGLCRSPHGAWLWAGRLLSALGRPALAPALRCAWWPAQRASACCCCLCLHTSTCTHPPARGTAFLTRNKMKRKRKEGKETAYLLPDASDARKQECIHALACGSTHQIELMTGRRCCQWGMARGLVE